MESHQHILFLTSRPQSVIGTIVPIPSTHWIGPDVDSLETELSLSSPNFLNCGGDVLRHHHGGSEKTRRRMSAERSEPIVVGSK